MKNAILFFAVVAVLATSYAVYTQMLAVHASRPNAQTELFSNASAQIVPGVPPQYSCPLLTSAPQKVNIVSLSGMTVYNISGVSDYVLQPGSTGSITYGYQSGVYTVSNKTVSEVIIRPQASSASIYTNATFYHQQQVEVNYTVGVVGGQVPSAVPEVAPNQTANTTAIDNSTTAVNVTSITNSTPVNVTSVNSTITNMTTSVNATSTNTTTINPISVPSIGPAVNATSNSTAPPSSQPADQNVSAITPLVPAPTSVQPVQYQACYDIPNVGTVCKDQGSSAAPAAQTEVSSVSYTHPGISSYITSAPSSGVGITTSATMTIATNSTTPTGTYWIVIAGGPCYGGQTALLTIGNSAYSGTVVQPKQPYS